MIRNVVVVGGSLAGLRAVETLRTGGFDGTVTVIGDEPHLPYDRPPLSKRLLSGEWEPDRIALRKPDDMGTLDASWQPGVAATGLDLARRVGRRSRTVRPCRSTGSDRRHRRHGTHDCPTRIGSTMSSCLRTLDDALALRDRLLGGGKRVVDRSVPASSGSRSRRPPATSATRSSCSKVARRR